MKTIMKLFAAVALVTPLLCVGQASAATYTLPIRGGVGILKIFLDNGVAHRARGSNGDTTLFDVDMNGDECVAFLTIAFTDNASPLHTRYDVCSEKGFELRTTRLTH